MKLEPLYSSEPIHLLRLVLEPRKKNRSGWSAGCCVGSMEQRIYQEEIDTVDVQVLPIIFPLGGIRTGRDSAFLVMLT